MIIKNKNKNGTHKDPHTQKYLDTLEMPLYLCASPILMLPQQTVKTHVNNCAVLQRDSVKLLLSNYVIRKPGGVLCTMEIIQRNQSDVQTSAKRKYFLEVEKKRTFWRRQ